jgi:hypothetical protein
MVFENIFSSLEGVNTISTMEKLCKIRVACIANSVAMMLSEAKISKFFCKVQRHRVLRGDPSYFDQIPSHSDWAEVASEFRMRLQEALAKFKKVTQHSLNSQSQLALALTHWLKPRKLNYQAGSLDLSSSLMSICESYPRQHSAPAKHGM